MLNMIMTKQYVRVLVDVDCSWSKNPPRYRAFVNQELFCERTWIWHDVILEETFQIEATPGKYEIRFELLDKKRAQLEAKNYRIEHGPATITPWGELEIRNED